MTLLRYAWAAPNTLLGLLFVPLVWTGGGNVRIVDGAIEMHADGLGWLLRRCTPIPSGADALTLGHVVLGRSRAALERSRRHERVHVRQYERWGPLFLPAYLLSSVLAWLRGSDREACGGPATARPTCRAGNGSWPPSP